MTGFDPPGGTDLRTRGLRMVAIGVVVAVVAAIVTTATYSAAQGSGGTYYVLYGPIVLGVILVGMGLGQLSRARAAARPGWHPDPTGRHDRRWWDGARWTSEVTDGEARGSDPVPGADVAGTPETSQP